MTDLKIEPFYVRYAWILLLLVSILSLWIGIGDFTRAGDADPALVESALGFTWGELQNTNLPVVNLINLLSRLVGSLWIGFSLLAIIVSATGFRMGDRWAWYGLWTIPLVMSLIFATFFFSDLAEGSPNPPALYSAPGLFAIAVIGLLLPIRRFFPSKNRAEMEMRSRA
jgi:hypothetical protein